MNNRRTLYNTALLAALALPFWLGAQHNNELYNNGAEITVQNGAQVYVLGDMHQMRATGRLTNNGFIEVQGDAYSDNLFQQRGTGTLRMHNRTVNLFSSQFISGSYAVRGGQAQIGVNDGSFFNLELANSMGRIYLQGTGNVADVRGAVNFQPAATGTPANTIITHAFSSPANGSNYDAVFGVMNPTAGLGNFQNNTVSANGTTSGVDVAYIQGKLRRAIAPAGGVYGFPMGLRPGAPVAEGVQYITLDLAANTYDVITGYFEKGSDNTIAGAPTQCGGNVGWYSGTPHGEWVLSPIAAGTGTYSVVIYPQDYPVQSYSQYFITKDNAIAGTANQCGANPVGLTRSGFTSFSEFGFAAIEDVLLSEDKIQIHAQAQENRYISVDWAVENESEVFMYELERSEDAVSFEYIGDAQVLGELTCGGACNYQINDEQVVPNKIYYYRIKLLLQDGSSQHTRTVAAQIQPSSNSNAGEIRLYPNPLTGANTFQLEVPSEEEDEAQIQIFDALGRRLYSSTERLNVGMNRWEFSVSGWAAGVYYVHIKSAQFATTRELLKTQ